MHAPPEIVTSDELEVQLAPLYDRLKLPYGRLELMTGILERGLWEPGQLPGDQSVVTVDKLLRTAKIDRSKIGAFIHASVCATKSPRPPATYTEGYFALNGHLRRSNACLGLLTGAILIANMIELY